ncbi:MAG: single-stranded DNA-binding protein [Streptosporangiaceae bacterium]
MAAIVTVAGELIGAPEYQETAHGKTAVFYLSVMTRHRVDDEWIDDPPVTYRVVTTDEESIGVAASLAEGSRVLVSGLLHSTQQPPVIEADGVSLSLNFRRR